VVLTVLGTYKIRALKMS